MGSYKLSEEWMGDMVGGDDVENGVEGVGTGIDCKMRKELLLLFVKDMYCK